MINTRETQKLEHMIFILYTILVVAFFTYCAIRQKKLKQMMGGFQTEELKLKTALSSGLIIILSLLLAYPDLLKCMYLLPRLILEFISGNYKAEDVHFDSFILDNQDYSLLSILKGTKTLLLNISLVMLVYLVNLIEKIVHREGEYLRPSHMLISFGTIFCAIFLHILLLHKYSFMEYVVGYELVFILFVIMLGIQQYKLLLHCRVLPKNNVVKLESIDIYSIDDLLEKK